MENSNGISYAKQRETDDRNARVFRSLKDIKNKFLIMSGKGGVGKTSVATNLAISLAKKGLKVGLMDVDIHGPDIPRMLGLKENLSETYEQKMIPISYNDNLKVVSVESLTAKKDEAVIWRGSMKHNTIKRFLGDVEWGNLDYLLIDCPPGTGDEPLTVAQTIRDAKAIIVTTPQEISLADVRKSISFCNSMYMDIFGLVENMSGFDCPHCGKAIELFGTGGGKKTANNSSNRFLGRIPFDMRMVVCSDNGISFPDKYENSEVSKAFDEITEKMIKY